MTYDRIYYLDEYVYGKLTHTHTQRHARNKIIGLYSYHLVCVRNFFFILCKNKFFEYEK